MQMTSEMMRNMNLSPRDMVMAGLKPAGLDDGTLEGEPTQDGGGVSGDPGTEPRG